MRIDNERYEAALPIFDRLLALDQSALADAGLSYGVAIFGSLAHESRAICLMRLERYEEAATAYEDAERCAPNDPSLAPKRQLALARARR